MCYCEKCKKDVQRPKMGPRKVLESGFFKPTVYDLNVEYSYYEYETYVKAYYYKRDLYCPKCGSFIKEMNHYWAEKFGEIAPRHMITRYYEYCRDNGLINEHFFEYHNYPGEPI